MRTFGLILAVLLSWSQTGLATVLCAHCAGPAAPMACHESGSTEEQWSAPRVEMSQAAVSCCSRPDKCQGDCRLESRESKPRLNAKLILRTFSFGDPLPTTHGRADSGLGQLNGRAFPATPLGAPAAQPVAVYLLNQSLLN